MAATASKQRPAAQYQDKPDLQWRFAFSTPAEESSTYSIVSPVLQEASAESIDENDAIKVLDRFVADPNNPDQWPVGAPRVSVSVDQRSGQVNICVGPAARTGGIARSPAVARILPQMPPARQPVEPERIVRLAGPQPIAPRDLVPSPAGVAIRTPGGIDFVPAGSIRTPSGTRWTPKGTSYSPGGTCYWPVGTQFYEDGSAVTPAGTMYTPSGMGYGPAGHLYTPAGTTYSPSGFARSTWKGEYVYSTQSPSAVGVSQPSGAGGRPLMAQTPDIETRFQPPRTVLVPPGAPSAGPESLVVHSPSATSSNEALRSEVGSPTLYGPLTPEVLAPALPRASTMNRPLASPNLANLTETQPAIQVEHRDRVLHLDQIPVVSPMAIPLGPFEGDPAPVRVVPKMHYWPPEPPENIIDTGAPARPVFTQAYQMVSQER